jgi:Family of unknown function (DUF6788)
MANKEPQRLLQRRRKAVARLGEVGKVLRASLLERLTQCGKGGCKCMAGQKHGPSYYLTVSYPKGKTRQIYVSKDLKKIAESWIENYHRVWAALEEISEINLELLRLKDPLLRG